MVTTKELVQYTQKLLQAKRFKDYCPNGLQIEGRSEIHKIIAGVSANQAFIDAAISANADAILVHHGYFWRGEPAEITGVKKKRIQALLMNDINLIAYHLPLDAHATLGNNARLAELLACDVAGSMSKDGVGDYGQLQQACSVDQFCKRLALVLGQEPMHVGSGVETIRTIGWCTGAAQDMVDKAIELELDAFVSGEISERTVHVAREAGIHYFAAGHHATERYGVQALGEHVADKFDLDYAFIDIANPV